MALWATAIVLATLMAASQTASIGQAVAAKKRGTQAASTRDDLNWSSKTQWNGSFAVTVKQSISRFWESWIGADMMVVRESSTKLESLQEMAANGGSVPQSSGRAWAVATVPGLGFIWDKTVLEAAADSSEASSTFGAALIKSVPLSYDYSLNLQIGCYAIQQGVLPSSGIAGHLAGTRQSATITIPGTGTSFIAGRTILATDDKWLLKFGAEQKLFDNVSVSGSISEIA
ncbi:hypothetical protein AYJ54_05395 [Bradyrhizobium centrolobii]|uniref:Uncharacterized protein n=1 Tax=Bradyrhizobium centrolobii TaxID=1505087 RepID=A0A176Z9Z2_9BRAD|nr:hypothetical protein [Bradyrhizobium centrolobii]OAF16586.1 hypothetical protein AYJ54_05395 [Bradyrhizobium centrolobii]